MQDRPGILLQYTMYQHVAAQSALVTSIKALL